MLQATNAFSSFSVNDIEKTKIFYEKTLGLTIKENPMGLLELHFPNGQRVLIYPKPNHEPATFTVLNFPIENIENAVDEISAKGVKFLQYEAQIKTDPKGICRSDKGPNLAWFKDPAGNILAVLED